MIPEISVESIAQAIKSEEQFVLLDVREPAELEKARINDRRLQVCPLSRLAREGTKVLPESALAKENLIYVLCHHGNRSAQVTAWLMKQGWKNVFSVAGGIEEYAQKVDPSVGFY